MNRCLLVFLVLLSVSFSENSFGSALIEIERVWSVHCPAQSCSVEFDGMLIVNNSNQRVISIETEPAMNITDGNGGLRASYHGVFENGTTILRGTALVQVDYDTELTNDPLLLPVEVNSTELVACNAPIAGRAAALAVNSSLLETIRKNVEWVHKNVDYDISYFGVSKDAQAVFMERRGVCVEYSHLLISMLNSLGIKTRYINGYVLAGEWQPHAWVEAEIPGYGWLPLDATFNQVGILDSSHVMISYGLDQRSVYDRIVSKSPDIMLDSETTVKRYSPVENPKGLEASLRYDNQTHVANVNIRNTRNEYVFALYRFSSPREYWGDDTALLLIEPLERVQRGYEVNYETLPEGYVYSVPLEVAANDAKASTQAVIRKGRALETVEDNLCVSALIALAILPVVLWSKET